jgi:hypothetical protein
LEGRLLMAGNVSVSLSGSGNVTIKGDNLANSIEVRYLATTNKYLVVGFQDTRINNQTTPFEFDASRLRRNMTIDLRDGDDSCSIRTIKDGSQPEKVFRVPGQLGVVTGVTRSSSDEDRLFMEDLRVRDMVVKTGAKRDIVQYARVKCDRNASFDAGNGDDNCRMQEYYVGRDLFVVMDGSRDRGNDSLEMLTCEVGRNASYRMYDGQDIMAVTNMKVWNNMFIDCGAGNLDQCYLNDVELTKTLPPT